VLALYTNLSFFKSPNFAPIPSLIASLVPALLSLSYSLGTELSFYNTRRPCQRIYEDSPAEECWEDGRDFDTSVSSVVKSAEVLFAANKMP